MCKIIMTAYYRMIKLHYYIINKCIMQWSKKSIFLEKQKNFSRDFFLKQKFFQLSKINSLSLWIMVNVAFYVKVGRDYALVFFTK